MTHPGHDGTAAEGSAPPAPIDSGAGPDPVIGAGLALLGIFVMAVGGARDLHYVFDAGVGIAILGAIIFVLSVALSAMKQRRQETKSEDPPA